MSYQNAAQARPARRFRLCVVLGRSVAYGSGGVTRVDPEARQLGCADLELFIRMRLPASVRALRRPAIRS